MSIFIFQALFIIRPYIAKEGGKNRSYVELAFASRPPRPSCIIDNREHQMIAEPNLLRRTMVVVVHF